MLFHCLTWLHIAPIFVSYLEAASIVFAMEGLPLTHESGSTAEFELKRSESSIRIEHALDLVGVVGFRKG